MQKPQKRHVEVSWNSVRLGTFVKIWGKKIMEKTSELFGLLRSIRKVFTVKLKSLLYNYYNKPILSYGILVHGSTAQSYLEKQK